MVLQPNILQSSETLQAGLEVLSALLQVSLSESLLTTWAGRILSSVLEVLEGLEGLQSRTDPSDSLVRRCVGILGDLALHHPHTFSDLSTTNIRTIRRTLTSGKSSDSKQTRDLSQWAGRQLLNVYNNNVDPDIATSVDVLLYNVTHKDRETRSVLDTIGAIAPINYSSETHFVTGQNDAIFCYNPEGRGQCYAFEGKKRLMYWYRGYLTTLSDEGLDKATITIFDVQNKFIGFTALIKPILAVISEWGSIFLSRIHQLLEKDTQSKLTILFRKNFYNVSFFLKKTMYIF